MLPKARPATASSAADRPGPAGFGRILRPGKAEAVAQGKKTCILALEERLEGYQGCRTLTIGSLAHPETIAHTLFATLRRMDDEGVETLLCEAIGTGGIGLAIMNRMVRAASFQVLEV